MSHCLTNCSYPLTPMTKLSAMFIGMLQTDRFGISRIFISAMTWLNPSHTSEKGEISSSSIPPARTSCKIMWRHAKNPNMDILLHQTYSIESTDIKRPIVGADEEWNQCDTLGSEILRSLGTVQVRNSETSNCEMMRRPLVV
jgi:hypothetical protein